MDPELLTKVFYAVSLAVDAAFIAMVVYLLWRMEKSTSKANQDVQESAERMRKSLDNLHKWGSGFQVWGRQFMLAAQRMVPPPGGEASTEALDQQIQRVTQAFEALDVGRLRRLINELDVMIRALKDEPSVHARSGAGAGATSIQPLNGTAVALQQEVELLQTRLNDATKVIYDLRRENRTAVTSSTALESLRQTNERLTAELKFRRDKQEHLTERFDRIEDLLRNVSIQVHKSKPGPAEGVDAIQQAQLIDLQVRLEAVEKERARLNEQLVDIEGALGRTLREKEMVEDRFLNLVRD